MTTPFAREALLVAVVALAFTVETALGFGATVVTVALGAMLVPIGQVLPAFVPLNMVLSAWLALRGREHVAWPLLGKRVLPWMGLGLPLGLLGASRVDEALLVRVFGVFVVALSAVELSRMRRAAQLAAAPSGSEPPRPERGRASSRLDDVLLVLGGLVHGAFATGGPMVVYVTGRALVEKERFRATLAVLWLTLNTVLVGTWLARGSLGVESLRRSGGLAVGLALGMLAGEWAHSRVPVRAFRVGVYVMLAVAGVLLTLRS